MRREQLTPTCRSALAAHQRDANAQAGAWVDRELRRELAPGRYDVTVEFMPSSEANRRALVMLSERLQNERNRAMLDALFV